MHNLLDTSLATGLTSLQSDDTFEDSPISGME